MEAQPRALITGAIGAIVLLAGAFGVGGCASAPKNAANELTRDAAPSINPARPNAEVMGPPEPYGPPLPPALDGAADLYGPAPVVLRPVVLVLGPGLARGYAYVGAIRALSEAKVPIAAVLGTEMGALVGALYAMDAKINQFEWAMLKFREGVFENPSHLLPEVFVRGARSKKLDAALAGTFKKRDLSQSALPLRVAIQTQDAGPAVLGAGSAQAALRAALADPDLFDPGTWRGGSATSAAKSKPLLISEARALGLGPVIVIDAMDPVDEKRLVSTAELQDADLVIRPDLSGIGPQDFPKRTEAAFRGKSAILNQLADIQRLVGMPVEAEPRKDTP